MRDFFRTLTGRAVLVTVATSIVSVIVTALVAVPVAVRSVNSQVRAELVEKSALAVELLTDERPAAREKIAQRLRKDQIEIYLLRRGIPDHQGLPALAIAQVRSGALVDMRGRVAGRASFIAGRPLPGVDAGVVLTRPASPGLTLQVLGSVWWALLAGLVGGILAGALLARFVAGRLAAGDRSVRIARHGPAEAVRLAEAVNQLAAALQTSEGRERDFLLSVSHELRTPLATIRGYAEALADGVVGADGAEQAGATMVAEADRLDRLISDLLVLSRLEAADLPLDVVAVNLVELVREAGQAWSARCAADGPSLAVELPDAPVTVETDPGRIRQVLDGLCENALRVVPSGVPLVLAVRAGESGGVVEVRDGGPGFTDEDLAVAFERGALNRRYRGIRKVGSGLGLALAARLVGRLGGRIEAGHAPEGGAMFTVELPYRTPGNG